MIFLTDKIRFLLLSYFAKNICPDRFSLSNEQAKKNDFYEVHIYVPKASNKEISDMPRKGRRSLDIKFEFTPSKGMARCDNFLVGRSRYSGSTDFIDDTISIENLRYARIDVNYFFGYWNIREQGCSNYMLFHLFLLRFIKGVHVVILKNKIISILNRYIYYRNFKSPLKSKYEIYEALMGSDEFLRKGSFRKSELTKALFGNHYIGEYSIYQKVSKSLDWILDACVEDGELKKVGTQDDPQYEMKGKGIHYFTLTKEHIKSEQANRRIQRQQVKIQKSMVRLTVMIVIGTFLSVVDKLEKIKQVFSEFLIPLKVYIDSVVSMLAIFLNLRT